MKDYKYEQTEVKRSMGGEEFSFSSNREIRKGFTIALPSASSAQSPLPALKRGESLEVDGVKLEEKFTGPPDYLTESDLITLMEKHGIGTDASIPVHINNIIQLWFKCFFNVFYVLMFFIMFLQYRGPISTLIFVGLIFTELKKCPKVHFF